MIKIISRQEAIKKGLTHYFTGRPCKRGHLEKRHIKYKSCLKCDLIKTKKYQSSFDLNKYFRDQRLTETMEEKKERLRKRRIIKKKIQDKINKDPIKREKYLADKKKYSHTKKAIETRKLWKLNNRDYINEYIRNKKKNDPIFKLSETLRIQLLRGLRNKGLVKKNKALELLGIDIKKFKLIFQKKFKPGMNWTNHGKWHIDHIKPISKFDLTRKGELEKCFHYTNLQPLWAKVNQSKGNKY